MQNDGKKSKFSKIILIIGIIIFIIGIVFLLPAINEKAKFLQIVGIVLLIIGLASTIYGFKTVLSKNSTKLQNEVFDYGDKDINGIINNAPDETSNLLSVERVATQYDKQELISVIAPKDAESQTAVDKPFLMAVEDVFTIMGRGTVVTGKVERGIVKMGDVVDIVGIRKETKTTITGVEIFGKLSEQAQAGDNVGLFLRGVDKKDITKGQVLAKTKSIASHTEFEAKFFILKEEEGGIAISNKQQLDFWFRTMPFSGVIKFSIGQDCLMPGYTTEGIVLLNTPVALEEGVQFAIRKNGETCGAGVITRIIK